MKKFNRIIVTIGVDRKPHFQIEYIENGEIYVGSCSCDFEKVLKWKEENLDVKEIVVNQNGKMTYEQGRTDAWEAARKIICEVFYGGFTREELYEIFGEIYASEIMVKFTAAEAIAKIKAYEGKRQKIEQEIKIGDEVVENDDISKLGVVTYIKLTVSGNLYNVLWDDGRSCGYYGKEIKKTGRHFPQVEELLKAMKEE